MSAHERICGICFAPISPGEDETVCPSCRACYHAECWQENRGCAAYGCTEAPVAEMRRDVEIPVSYWGLETKACPNCGQEILAAAVRCRHCGATFASAQPQQRQEFERQSSIAAQLPRARRMVIWLFVGSIISFAAPVAAVWSFAWYASHRDVVAALPRLYRVLCRLAMGVAAGQTAALAIIIACYAWLHR